MHSRKRVITWKAIFFDERVCVGPFINRSGRSGDDRDADFNSWVMYSTRTVSQRIVRIKCSTKDKLPRVRAFVLSPRLSITSGDGPMKAMPACSTLRANSAFSDKKPYLRCR